MADVASYRARALLPSLPDDLAVLCLVRVPVMRHGHLRLVNSAWRAMIDSDQFRLKREELGLLEDWLILLKNDFCYSTEPQAGPPLLRTRSLAGTKDKQEANLDKTEGGLDSESAEGEDEGPYHCLCCYIMNVAEGWWVQVPLPKGLDLGLESFAGAVLEGKVYIFGGMGIDCYPREEVWRYDPRVNLWQAVARMAEGRSRFFAEVLGAEIHLMGGTDGPGTSCIAYNLKEDSWRPLASTTDLCLHRIEGVKIDDALYAWENMVWGDEPAPHDPIFGSEPLKSEWVAAM